MADLAPESLDLPTLATLAGQAASDHLVTALRGSGYAGARASHGYVVQVLLRSSPTIGELALELGVTQQAVSKTVGEMEALGYVERSPSPDDGRVRRVGLTARGTALVGAAREQRSAIEAAVADVVGPDDVAAGRRVLAALLDVAGGRAAVTARRVRPPQD